MKKPRARIESESAGDEVDDGELSLRGAGGNIDDDILFLAVDHVLKDIADKLVMPVDSERNVLPLLEEVLREIEVFALADVFDGQVVNRKPLRLFCGRVHRQRQAVREWR